MKIVVLILCLLLAACYSGMSKEGEALCESHKGLRHQWKNLRNADITECKDNVDFLTKSGKQII